jgi:CBS-domain-containing membrane protein
LEVLDVIRTLGKGSRGPTAESRKHTAADLMIPATLVIPTSTTIDNALALLTQKGLNLAAVVDTDEQPVGFVTRRALDHPDGEKDLLVGDVMTPIFFSVRPEAPAARVIEEIRSLRLRNIFVIAGNQEIAGVICESE